MKKVIFFLMSLISLCFTLESSAQVYNYHCNKFCVARKEEDFMSDSDSLEYIYIWSDWINCTVDVEIDAERALINICSSKKYHTYKLLDSIPDNAHPDPQTVTYIAVGDDDKVCRCRIHVTEEGDKMIYLDYRYVTYCYGCLEQYLGDKKRTM